MNTRIERQQGVFLVQTNLPYSFEKNLESMLTELHFLGSVRKIVIVCTEEVVTEALIDLRRMSITFENLFGDVNYFCKSLALGIINTYGFQTDSNGTSYLKKRKV